MRSKNSEKMCEKLEERANLEPKVLIREIQELIRAKPAKKRDYKMTKFDKNRLRLT